MDLVPVSLYLRMTRKLSIRLRNINYNLPAYLQTALMKLCYRITVLYSYFF